jgi:hypothetical protein
MQLVASGRSWPSYQKDAGIAQLIAKAQPRRKICKELLDVPLTHGDGNWPIALTAS